MPIEARIVSDSSGKIEGTYIPTGSKTAVSIVGTIRAKDVYTFYAVTTSGADMQEITIVLPVGGVLSGLYRFPRVGEKVLVSIDDSGKFLLGYIPSEGSDPFAPVENAKTIPDEVDKLNKNQGMILRYQQTGKKTDKVEDGEEYSEIGFYHEPTSWKAGENTTKNNYKGNFDALDANNIPAIDKIKIHSTGDIRTEAVNHHLIMAKRFELLAGCEEIIHKSHEEKVGDTTTKYDADTTVEGELPIGDHTGDDSALHGGDVHIRAGNRVIIKADEEIRLQVGRTILTISDDGFDVITKLHTANMMNVYNTLLSMTPRDGITLAGQTVTVEAMRELKLKDGMGGGLSSALGVVELKGREMEISVSDATKFRVSLLGYTLKYIQGISAAAMSLADVENINIAEYINFALETLQKGADLIGDFKDTLEKQKDAV
jgi:hypothetical protein